MLSEEMADNLPEEPLPEKLQAWYHSDVTQWFIQAHLKLEYQKILESFVSMDNGIVDADSPYFYKFQGAARNLEELVDIIESFSKPEGDDNEL